MIITTKNSEPFSLKREIYRKIFHLLILLFPIGYEVLGKEHMLKILAIISIILIPIDYLRRKSHKINVVINKIFSIILRKEEQKAERFYGSSYALIAALLVFSFVQKEIAIISFLILAICDLTASLIGKSIPSKPFFEKSFIGSLSFYISGVLVLFVCGAIFKTGFSYYIFAFFALFVSTIIEARPSLFKIDDNFMIPISFAFVMTLFDMVWGII